MAAKRHKCDICKYTSNMKRISISMSDEEHAKIKKAAWILGISMVGYMRHCIHDVINKVDTVKPLLNERLTAMGVTHKEKGL